MPVRHKTDSRAFALTMTPEHSVVWPCHVQRLGLATADQKLSVTAETESFGSDSGHHTGLNKTGNPHSSTLPKAQPARGAWRWRRAWLHKPALLAHMDVYPVHTTAPQRSLAVSKHEPVHLRTLEFLNNFQGDRVGASESCVANDSENTGLRTDVDASDVDAVNAACEAIARRANKGRKVMLFSGKEDYRSQWFRAGFDVAGLVTMSVGVEEEGGGGESSDERERLLLKQRL